MACGFNCFGKYEFSLTPSYRPPIGGWRVPSIPPGLLPDQSTQNRLEFVWRQQAQAQNHSPQQAVDELIGFLRQNGQNISADKKTRISEFADIYWCSLEPDRCRGVRRAVAVEEEPTPEPEQAMVAPTEIKLKWAKNFWSTFNVMVASDSDTPAEDVDRMARVGLTLLSGTDGCPHCFQHWTEVLESFPPVALIKNSAQARIWLWAAHTASHEGKMPVPYLDISRLYKWPEVTADVVQQFLVETGMLSLVQR